MERSLVQIQPAAMKIIDNMRVYHDNDYMLGEIYVDRVWNRVRFRPGKINTATGAWVLGGTMDSDDLKKLSKVMAGMQRSIDTKSLTEKIKDAMR